MKKNDKFVTVNDFVPVFFRRDGVEHKLIYKKLVSKEAKIGTIVGVGVYELTYHKSPLIVGYNVVNFRCRINPFNLDVYTPYPSKDKWGVDGFSKYSLEGAMKKVKELEGALI